MTIKEVEIDTSEYLLKAEEKLAEWSKASIHPEDNRLDIQIAAADLLTGISALLELDCWYLSAITGLDNYKPADLNVAPTQTIIEGTAAEVDDTLESLYHFCCHAAVVTLRVKVPRNAPSIPSVCSLIPTATLYERELIDLLGFDIQGTPNTDRLVLSDDWPRGVFPLRKDFKGLPMKFPEK